MKCRPSGNEIRKLICDQVLQFTLCKWVIHPTQNLFQMLNWCWHKHTPTKYEFITHIVQLFGKSKTCYPGIWKWTTGLSIIVVKGQIWGKASYAWMWDLNGLNFLLVPRDSMPAFSQVFADVEQVDKEDGSWNNQQTWKLNYMSYIELPVRREAIWRYWANKAVTYSDLVLPETLSAVSSKGRCMEARCEHLL